MLILEMIIRITNWTQEELAKFLGVSRVTINYWLNGNDISLQSKKLISEKFGFPIAFFNISLNENIESYKIVYSTLYKNINEKIIKKENEMSEKDKIADILNRIEFDDKTVYNKEIEEDDILDGLANGYNPFTGEIFDENHILNNELVKKTIKKIKNKYHKFGVDNIEIEDLSNRQKEMFDKLKKWRINTTVKEGFYGAYMVFTDKELMNIVCATINEKEDLLSIKGIGEIKYEKYGDALFEILKDGSEI